jgi:hypothetical protein
VKREWENLGKFLCGVAAAWFIVGCITFLVVASLNEGPSGEVRGPGIIALCAWIGPFLIAGVLFALVCFIIVAPDWIPRRVQRPVLEDARDARKRGAA